MTHSGPFCASMPPARPCRGGGGKNRVISQNTAKMWAYFEGYVYFGLCVSGFNDYEVERKREKGEFYPEFRKKKR